MIATSALDSKSENAVNAAIENIIREQDITVILAAHRLSSVARAEQVIVLEGGIVSEEGRYDVLVSYNPHPSGDLSWYFQAEIYRGIPACDERGRRFVRVAARSIGLLAGLAWTALMRAIVPAGGKSVPNSHGGTAARREEQLDFRRS